MTIDTIKYYPYHIQKMKEYQRISAGYDEKLSELWKTVGLIQLNMYPSTMDEDTCAKWESFLGIEASLLDSLDDRRAVISGYFASDLPYTEKKMNEVLAAMYGEGSYKLVIDASVGLITIYVYLSAVRMADNMRSRIRAMAPADMDVVVSVVYNRHSTYTAYAHEALSAYTHEQLRSDEQFQNG